MRVYLAHPMGTYGSPRESQAIALLAAAGHEVINPRERQYGQSCGKHMARWARLASACEAIALLPFKDGKMGAGMKMELDAAWCQGRHVLQITPSVEAFIELTSLPPTRAFLDIATTSRRNEGGRKWRHREGVPFLGENTVLRPELVDVAMNRLKKIMASGRPASPVVEAATPSSPRHRFRPV